MNDDWRNDGELIQTCVICKDQFSGYGHNAMPAAEGRCCTSCNDVVVIPTRIRKFLVTKPRNQPEKKEEG